MRSSRSSRGRFRQFPLRLIVLLLIHREIMPLHPALHEGHATPFHGAQQDDEGSTAATRQRGVEGLRLMPVYLFQMKPKPADFWRQRFERGDLGGRAEALQAIGVDQDHEIVEIAMLS